MGSGEVKQVVAQRFSATETLGISSDLASTASDKYKAHNDFTGAIGSVNITPAE